MRMLILSNATHGGGAEKSAFLLFEGLKSQNRDVQLLVVNAVDADWKRSNKGQGILTLGRGKNESYLRFLPLLIKYQFVLLKIRPHLVILNCEVPELLHALVISRTRIIAVEHTTNPWNFSPQIGKIIRRILQFKKTQWVGVATENVIWPRVTIPAKTIYNPIHPIRLDKSPLYFHKVRRLVFIGRLSSEKNPWAVMRIAKRLKKPVLFIGEGREGDRLRSACQEEGVDADFKGFQSNPWDFIESGDLMLIPSLWEGDGMVIREAVSLGIPILLSRINDLKRFDLPERNFCESEDDFVSRILEYGNRTAELIVDPALKLKIIQNRDSSTVLANWVDLITNEVNDRNYGKRDSQ